MLREGESLTEDGGRDPVTLFLTGDVMTGRGIDQVFPESSSPELYESYMTSALAYVRLAERASGPIPGRVDHAYVWGDALDELERVGPDARIINLETAVTTSDTPEPKGINYRMHPSNAACFTIAGVDCAVLANNHTLDWGEAGLLETLDTLESRGIPTAGAGRDLHAAQAPAVIELAKGGRILVFGLGLSDSGIPPHWRAGPAQAGVWLVPDISDVTVSEVSRRVAEWRRPGDIVLASVHWGGNWGYAVHPSHRRFARALVDEAGVDVVHGHSSHHPKGIEVHDGRLILYGCGDFLNDYEGIRGHEEFRGDLVLMYFARLAADTGRLMGLELTPLRIRRFRLERTSAEETEWMRGTLANASRPLGTSVRRGEGGRLRLDWQGAERSPSDSG